MFSKVTMTASDSAMYTCTFAVITFLESRAPRSLNQKFEMDFSRLLSVTGRVCFLFGKLYTSLKSKQAWCVCVCLLKF